MSLSLGHKELATLAALEDEHREHFKSHVLTRAGEGPKLRAWRCAGTATPFYWFYAVSLPGRLILTGDTGDVVYSSLSDWGDVWAADPDMHADYIAGKIAVWPGDVRSKEARLSWFANQLSALRTFGRLRLAEVRASEGEVPAPAQVGESCQG